MTRRGEGGGGGERVTRKENAHGCCTGSFVRSVNSEGKIGSRHETTFATTKKPLDASPWSPGMIRDD